MENTDNTSLLEEFGLTLDIVVRESYIDKHNDYYKDGNNPWTHNGMPIY